MSNALESPLFTILIWMYDSYFYDQSVGNNTYGNRYTFQGREIDWATRTNLLPSKVVQPSFSKDLIGIAGGLNLYEAFGSNPVVFIDPLGEDIAYIKLHRHQAGHSMRKWGLVMIMTNLLVQK